MWRSGGCVPYACHRAETAAVYAEPRPRTMGRAAEILPPCAGAHERGGRGVAVSRARRDTAAGCAHAASHVALRCLACKKAPIFAAYLEEAGAPAGQGARGPGMNSTRARHSVWWVSARHAAHAASAHPSRQPPRGPWSWHASARSHHYARATTAMQPERRRWGRQGTDRGVRARRAQRVAHEDRCRATDREPPAYLACVVIAAVDIV